MNRVRRILAIPAGIRLDGTAVDGCVGATENAVAGAFFHDAFEQSAQPVAICKTAIPVLGESRAVRHTDFQPELAEPPVCQIEVNLLDKPSLGPDAVQIANQKYAQHQLRIDTFRGAIKRSQLLADHVEVNSQSI